jgi:hypothetical protein
VLGDSNHRDERPGPGIKGSEAGRAGYAEGMTRRTFPCALFTMLLAATFTGSAQTNDTTWSFGVSGDSRNCGDFVMPAIAAEVKSEHDAFYWHLGDFRWMTDPDQDLISMLPKGKSLTTSEYRRIAWDDFLTRQMSAFGPVPVFLGRGNHENVAPMTRESYIAKFASFLDRPEIAAQRKDDGEQGAPVGPWYHWTHEGVDFITLDNSSRDEFSDAQLKWLRGVLDRDLAQGSGIRAIVAGMHEALPHSTGAEHAMDDWELGERTGDLVYTWFYDAQASGKHVYLIASHSHYYSPNIYDTTYWRQHASRVIPGLIIGAAGAYRYALPRDAKKGAKTHIYGFVEGTVHADGEIDFSLKEISEEAMRRNRWPNAPLDAIHECFVGNGDPAK